MAASPQHKSFPSSADETSPFSLLKGETCEDQGFILRTRSLDEANARHNGTYTSSMEAGDSQYEASTSATAALHASFDAALLSTSNGNDNSNTHSINTHNKQQQRQHETPFFLNLGEEDDKLHGNPARTASWDEEYNELAMSGRKHMLNPPGTIRKQPRRVVSTSKTPLRPRQRPPGAMKKPASTTPSSAVKRRRAPLPQRMSPMRRVSHSMTSPPPPNTTRLDNSIFANGANGSIFAASPALTPTHQTSTMAMDANKSTSKWHNTHAHTHHTGTTASTLMETTLESTDSVETSSPTTTRFRFTSFPASLPRVNNPRSNRKCPDSIRKHMSFAETTQSDANQSRDDDGTQNTSISSLSAEGHHQHLLPVPGALPPAILNLGPPQTNDNDPHKQPDSQRPLHAKLFADEENFGYSDDDSTQSPINDTVGRTRLNFNTAVSPEKEKTRLSGNHTMLPLDMELSKPYDTRRVSSFPSSLSSNTHINNLSGCEEPNVSLTPGRPTEHKFFPPSTPREVQLHFPLESECSPIPGVRDDLCHVDPNNTSDDTGDLIGDGLIPRKTSLETVDGSRRKGKEEASVGSDSSNTKSRRLRPMPDISAFETHATASRSSDDSTTLDSKGVSSTQRLTCPPTPVRTPAWANEGSANAFFGRQNSLITTKVLLSAPSQVLEGRSSLENSVLDDDSKGSNGRSKTRHIPPPPILERKGGLETEQESKKTSQDVPDSAVKIPRVPPKVVGRAPAENEGLVSFATEFEVLGVLGSGAFADVYKVQSRRNGQQYAVKRNRRQFRGRRDRDMALTEVQAMQRLQSVCAETGKAPSSAERSSYCLYLLFFYRAWQEDGYFFCQTELCCRDTCRELLDNMRFLWNTAKDKYPSLKRLPAPDNIEPGSMEDASGRLVPNDTIWKIAHDVAAGLSHIHSHGLVHHDIKPSNIFLVAHPRFGAMCKIGDFGIAGETGSSADGLEGDTRYMPSELLSSGVRHPASDIFSFGLTLYEIAADERTELPSEGPGWHELRGADAPSLPSHRNGDLLTLLRAMTHPMESQRPTADGILKHPNVVEAGLGCDQFLKDYVHDIEQFDKREEERLAMDFQEDQTPRNGSHRSTAYVRSPSLSMLAATHFLSPAAKGSYPENNNNKKLSSLTS